MSNDLLKGKRGTIFGALNDRSIAWKVVERAVEEGITITLSNTPMAVCMGEINALAEKLNCQVVSVDVASVEDSTNIFRTPMDILGGQVDFVLRSIGVSPSMRRKCIYDDPDHGMLDKTLDISAVSFHKMIRSVEKLNTIAGCSSIVALSYVAAQRTFYSYNDVVDAKTPLESIAHSFGYIYGREHSAHVNTISQLPTFTTTGSGVKGMGKPYDFVNRVPPLGDATANECTDYCIVIFSDLTHKVIMQNLFYDDSFSSVGMSPHIMVTYEEGPDECVNGNGNIIYG